MSSTFDGLRIARSGVQASRVNLKISGQNITNSETEGYTRQRVSQSALSPAEYGGFWASSGAVCGNGVSADSVVQLRNSFLDEEYRTQAATYGGSSEILSTLNQMEDIFTSTTTAGSSSDSSVVNVLNNEFSNFVSQLESFTSGKATEGNVREEAKLLASNLNSAAKSLKTVREGEYSDLSKYNVNSANGLMKNIASLNQSIKTAEVAGEPVLELKDQRNLMLDQLSKYAGVHVTYTPEDAGAGQTVDNCSVTLADSDGNPLKPPITLIDGDKFAQFSVTRDGNDDESGKPSGEPFDITHLRLSGLSADGGKTFGPDSGMKSSDLQTGSFVGYLKLLNESGEYDTTAGGVTKTMHGIGFYSQLLDTIARNFAATLNGDNVTKDGTQRNLLGGYGSDGKTESFDAKDITAENIHIASQWTDGWLVKSKDPGTDGKDNTDASYSNILKMLSDLKDTDLTLKTDAGVTVFQGTLQKAFAGVAATLGEDANSLQVTDTTNAQRLSSIDGNRQSISSVSLDDEAVSIVQYTQSLNASSRFMTAVDECLQTIISNMGMAGRG